MVTQLKLDVCYPATPVSYLQGVKKAMDGPLYYAVLN